MKLIRLEILNLASLDKDGGEVIDFTQGVLGESNIFSIVGPTGSGKSTLLDAICLALYGRTPRYNRTRNEKSKITIFGEKDAAESNRIAPNDSRNILTRGKKQGYSKLTFRANNGNLYRAEWHIRFMRVKHDKATTALYHIVTSPDGDTCEQEGDWAELPLIVGLDFEQFLRTVLIAQGAFASFLTATDDERFVLLEKLIGRERLYTRIIEGIKAKNDEASQAFTQICATVDANRQKLLSDEQLAELNQEIARLELAEMELAEKLKQVEAELQWFVDDEKMLTGIADKLSRAEQATASREAFDESARRLALHDALAEAVDLLREVNRLAIEQTQLQRAHDANESKAKHQTAIIETEKETLNRLQQAAEDAQRALDDATPHILRARELWTKIQGAKTALDERTATRKTARKQCDTARMAMDGNQAKIKRLEQTEEEARQKLIQATERLEHQRAELTEQVKNIEDALRSLLKQIEGQNGDELNQHKSIADKTLQELNEATGVVNKLTQTQAQQQECATQIDEAKRQIDHARDALGRLCIEALDNEVARERQLHTLMTSEKWERHRHLLADGTPCPLCGAESQHPYASDNRQFAQAISMVSEHLSSLEKELERQRMVERELNGTIKQNEGLLHGHDERLKQLHSEITELHNKWRTLHELHPAWPADAAKLEAMRLKLEQERLVADAALRKFNRTQAAINEQSKEKDSAIKERDEFEKESKEIIELNRAKVNECLTDLAAAKALSRTLLEAVNDKERALAQANEDCQIASNTFNELNEALRQELGGKQPDTYEEQLKKACREAEEYVKLKAEQIAQLMTDLSSLQGALHTQAEQLKQRQENHAEQSARLDVWIAEYNTRNERHGVIGRDTVARLLTATENWEELRKQKERLAAAETSARTLLEQARREHEAHQAGKPERGKDALLADQEKLKLCRKQDELVEAKTKLRSHNDAKQALGSKAEELSQAQHLRNDWQSIMDAIGGREGKDLRKIAQCYTLGFLIEYANAEIRKFNNRYELRQVRNSLGIRVIDHNRADDVRDTTSLSGGETFIVSLGLALGLSSLSSRNIRFDNLFIDEGFGSLDADTLATVIDSLAMLQTSQGKKVGVISHTDTMSERITTQIRIVPNGVSGSSHIEIWP